MRKYDYYSSQLAYSLLVRKHRTHIDISNVFIHREFSASESFQHLLKVFKEKITKYHKNR